MKKIIAILALLLPALTLPASDDQMEALRAEVRSRDWSEVIAIIQSGQIKVTAGEKPIWDFLLGYALEESERFGESVQPLARSAAVNSPVRDYALFYLGLAYNHLNERERGESSLKKIQGATYIYIPAHLALTRMYLNSDRLDQADSELALLQGKRLSDRLVPEKMLLEARLDRAQGRNDQADQKFRTLLVEYPAFKPGPRAEESPELKPAETLERCKKLNAQGYVKQAAKELTEMFANLPESDRRLVSQAMGVLAEARFKSKDYKGVTALERSAEQNAKSNAQFWFYLAWSYQRLQDDAMAAKLYAKCVNEFGDSDYAGQSLYHLARMEQEKRRISSALQYYDFLLKSFPENEFAEDAGFQLGLLAYSEGNYAKAVQAFNTTLQFASEPERFKYWLARSLENSGDPVRAAQLKQEILKFYPATVYAFLIDPCPKPNSVPMNTMHVPPAAVTNNFKTGLVLAWLGIYGLAEAELTWEIKNQPTFDKDLVYLLEQLEKFEAYPLAFKYFRDFIQPKLKPGEAGPYYEYLYPLAFSDHVMASAKKYGLEPAFVYSLIKQESAFNPSVSSYMGAMGLCQVMPPLAKKQAKKLGYGNISHEACFAPETNIELGFSHLEELFSRYQGAAPFPWQMILVECAYNAGMGRADKWFANASEKGIAPDLFIEQIPFLETRGYVKKIFSYLRIYRLRIPNNQPSCP
jgi:soluble lytic murein transglycosylase